MKTHLPLTLKTALFAGVLAAAMLGSASADIIYQDKFDRVGPLNGSAPTLDNTGGGATWISSGGYQTTGTNGFVNNSIDSQYQAGAHLPLDWTSSFPDPKVQVDALVAGSWLTLTLGDCDYWGYPSSTAMLKLYANGNVDVCNGPGWDGAFVITNVPGAGISGAWNRIRIEYSNTLGVATFYVNGNVVAQNIPISSRTTGVGFNSDTGNNTYFTNFLVTFGNENVTAPSITVQPQGSTVFVGDPLQLNLTAAGTLPLHYTWRKNGVDIPGPNASIYPISSSAAVSDSGNYSVVIANSAGSITSSVVRADVHLEAQSLMTSMTFEEPGTNYAYAFSFTYSSDGSLILPSAWSNNIPGGGVGGSTAGGVYADGSDFANGSVTYAGFGGGWAQNIRFLPTHNLDFYQCYFSARVENLIPSLTNTPGRLALRFYRLDSTGTNQTLAFSCENHFNYTSNFQDFSFKLINSDFGGAVGQALINQYYTNIFRVQFELTCDNFYTDFANGPGDALIVDNARLMYRQSPAVSVTSSAGHAVLSWADANVQVLGASSILGPWTAIPGATSPYTVPTGSPYNFFRSGFTPVP